MTPYATIAPRRCTTCDTALPTAAQYCVECGAANGGALTWANAAYRPPRRPSSFIATAQEPTPLIVRALWFVFIGLWLGPLWIVVGWLLNLTIIGMPLGLWLLNRTGNIMTLRRATPTALPSLAYSTANLVVRSIYFVLIGWWASLL